MAKPSAKLENQTAYALYKNAVEILTGQDIPDADLDAKYIVSRVLKTDFNAMVLDRSLAYSRSERARVMRLLKRRTAGEPVQYVLRSQNFYGLDFYVDRRVLIPRPETELLVEQAITCISPSVSISVLDLCTGSGCIAITLKTMRTNCNVWASDISPRALAVARKNARMHGADVSFLRSNLFARIHLSFDIIVSNPPYINRFDFLRLDPKVSRHEPKRALLGGKDGLRVIRKIINSAIAHLNFDGWLMLEIGYDQSDSVVTLLEYAGFSEIKVFSDYSEFDRIVIGKKPRS